jgi:hypothetical protein
LFSSFPGQLAFPTKQANRSATAPLS